MRSGWLCWTANTTQFIYNPSSQLLVFLLACQYCARNSEYRVLGNPCHSAIESADETTADRAKTNAKINRMFMVGDWYNIRYYGTTVQYTLQVLVRTVPVGSSTGV